METFMKKFISGAFLLYGNLALATDITYPAWFNPAQASKSYTCGNTTLTLDFNNSFKKTSSNDRSSQEIITGYSESRSNLNSAEKKIFIGMTYFVELHSDGTVTNTELTCSPKWNQWTWDPDARCICRSCALNVPPFSRRTPWILNRSGVRFNFRRWCRTSSLEKDSSLYGLCRIRRPITKTS